MNNSDTYEVIIIGGSYSGLSAAMALGRSLRRVLIIDSGDPCNKQTPHSHNFLTQDGATPGEISAVGKTQVLQYETVSFVQDKAVSSAKTDAGFIVHTESGKQYQASKLVFATGITDLMLPIKGLKECWGISVVHCPYCHGYEIRNKKTGIIANGENALHLAPLARNLTSNLTILTNGKAEFNAEQRAQLETNDVRILENEIIEIEHTNGHMKNLVFKGGTKEPFDATYASLPFQQHCDIPEQLGCDFDENGFIQVDMMHKTTVDGVFACGDNCSRFRSVANAVASGNMVGAVINMEMANQEFFD